MSVAGFLAGVIVGAVVALAVAAWWVMSVELEIMAMTGWSGE